MSGSLDKFLPIDKSKLDAGTLGEERCASPKCRKILKVTDIKYTITVKGEKKIYYQACAEEILRPQENTEENL